MKRNNAEENGQRQIRDYISNAQAAAFLDCSPDYLEGLRKNREITYVQHGRMIWYPIESIYSFLERHTVRAKLR